MLGAVGLLEALSSHRLLDRLIRGRLWIGIIAFALIGIVALQLIELRLNSGIGRSLERAGGLQRSNAALTIENSELAAGTRVESQAQRLGMRLTAVGGLRFHESHAGSDVAKAVAALKEPIKPAEGRAETTTSSTGTEPESGESASGASSGGASAEGEHGGEAAHEASGAGSAGAGQSAEASKPAAGPAGETSSSTTGTTTEAGGGTAAPGG